MENISSKFNVKTDVLAQHKQQKHSLYEPLGTQRKEKDLPLISSSIMVFNREFKQTTMAMRRH